MAEKRLAEEQASPDHVSDLEDDTTTMEEAPLTAAQLRCVLADIDRELRAELKEFNQEYMKLCKYHY
jgi:hypothetical protein